MRDRVCIEVDRVGAAAVVAARVLRLEERSLRHIVSVYERERERESEYWDLRSRPSFCCGGTGGCYDLWVEFFLFFRLWIGICQLKNEEVVKLGSRERGCVCGATCLLLLCRRGVCLWGCECTFDSLHLSRARETASFARASGGSANYITFLLLHVRNKGPLTFLGLLLLLLHDYQCIEMGLGEWTYTFSPFGCSVWKIGSSLHIGKWPLSMFDIKDIGNGPIVEQKSASPFVNKTWI